MNLVTCVWLKILVYFFKFSISVTLLVHGPSKVLLCSLVYNHADYNSMVAIENFLSGMLFVDCHNTGLKFLQESQCTIKRKRSRFKILMFNCVTAHFGWCRNPCYRAWQK